MRILYVDEKHSFRKCDKGYETAFRPTWDKQSSLKPKLEAALGHMRSSHRYIRPKCKELIQKDVTEHINESRAKTIKLTADYKLFLGRNPNIDYLISDIKKHNIAYSTDTDKFKL